MVNSSKRSPTSLELIISEIEATPKEYWTELLENLRQFRHKISTTTSPIVNTEQSQKNQAAIALLDSWLDENEDASEHQQTWNYLKKAMDKDRLSDRSLFR
jgi:isochorismate hydrolase